MNENRLSEKEYMFFKHFPQGDFADRESVELVGLLKDGWEILSSAGTYSLIVYILWRWRYFNDLLSKRGRKVKNGTKL